MGDQLERRQLRFEDASDTVAGAGGGGLQQASAFHVGRITDLPGEGGEGAEGGGVSVEVMRLRAMVVSQRGVIGAQRAVIARMGELSACSRVRLPTCVPP